MKQEKRKHVRTAFSARVKLIHPAVGELEVTMRDMSDGGVFLLTGDRADLPMGEREQIQALDIEEAPVLDAEIVRREATGIGLMFSED
jgi:c-di-GMP-binding flagellar brake protein YcgR